MPVSCISATSGAGPLSGRAAAVRTTTVTVSQQDPHAAHRWPRCWYQRESDTYPASTSRGHWHHAVMAMHEDQLEVRVDTVRRLIQEQFPQWAELAVREVPTAATVNAIFRVGDELAVRFPLRAEDPRSASAWLTSEAAAARELAEISPVPTPEPVALGEPGHGYPFAVEHSNVVARARRHGRGTRRVSSLRRGPCRLRHLPACFRHSGAKVRGHRPRGLSA